MRDGLMNEPLWKKRNALSVSQEVMGAKWKEFHWNWHTRARVVENADAFRPSLMTFIWFDEHFERNGVSCVRVEVLAHAHANHDDLGVSKSSQFSHPIEF